MSAREGKRLRTLFLSLPSLDADSIDDRASNAGCNPAFLDHADDGALAPLRCEVPATPATPAEARGLPYGDAGAALTDRFAAALPIA